MSHVITCFNNFTFCRERDRDRDRKRRRSKSREKDRERKRERRERRERERGERLEYIKTDDGGEVRIKEEPIDGKDSDNCLSTTRWSLFLI